MVRTGKNATEASALNRAEAHRLRSERRQRYLEQEAEQNSATLGAVRKATHLDAASCVVVQKDWSADRRCVYLVYRDKPGYIPINGIRGHIGDFALRENRKRGLSTEDVKDIVRSSWAAQLALDGSEVCLCFLCRPFLCCSAPVVWSEHEADCKSPSPARRWETGLYFHHERDWLGEQEETETDEAPVRA